MENRFGEIPDLVGIKDAVHVPIVSCIAGEDLCPGHAAYPKHGRYWWCPRDDDNAIGIVDPSRTSVIRVGSKFWLMLKPGSITSLRHEWSHPTFDKPEVNPEYQNWHDGIEKKFRVRLIDPGINKIAVMNEIRGILGIGLSTVRFMLASVPIAVKEFVDKDEAETIQKKLADAGAEVEVEFVPF